MQPIWLTLNEIVRAPDGEGGAAPAEAEGGDGDGGAAPEGDPKPDAKPPEGTPPDASADKKADAKSDEKGEDLAAKDGAAEALVMGNFKVPENFAVDEGTAEKFIDILSNTELSRVELGQQLLDLQSEALTAASEAASQQWVDTQAEWQQAIKDDKTLGGSKLDANLGQIAKVIDEYGSDDFRQMLDFTGAGNHPEMFRFLHNMSQVLTEGGPVSGRPGGGPRDPADVLYPDQGKSKK